MVAFAKEYAPEIEAPDAENRVWEFFLTTSETRRVDRPRARHPRREKPDTATKTASGMSYYGFRFYDPVHGRWLNRDPINELGSRLINSISVPLNQWEEMNRYWFVGNDALKWIDRLGLDRIPVDFEDSDPEEALKRARKIADAGEKARKVAEEAADDNRPGWVRRAIARLLGKTKNPRPDPASTLANLADPDAAEGLTRITAARACERCIIENDDPANPCHNPRNHECKEICDYARRIQE